MSSKSARAFNRSRARARSGAGGGRYRPAAIGRRRGGGFRRPSASRTRSQRVARIAPGAAPGVERGSRPVSPQIRRPASERDLVDRRYPHPGCPGAAGRRGVHASRGLVAGLSGTAEEAAPAADARRWRRPGPGRAGRTPRVGQGPSGGILWRLPSLGSSRKSAAASSGLACHHGPRRPLPANQPAQVLVPARGRLLLRARQSPAPDRSPGAGAAAASACDSSKRVRGRRCCSARLFPRRQDRDPRAGQTARRDAAYAIERWRRPKAGEMDRRCIGGSFAHEQAFHVCQCYNYHIWAPGHSFSTLTDGVSMVKARAAAVQAGQGRGAVAERPSYPGKSWPARCAMPSIRSSGRPIASTSNVTDGRRRCSEARHRRCF